MEAAVFEVHLIITGRLDVVSVHLQKTSTNVSKIKEINRADRCGADDVAGSLTKSTVFLLFVSASCPEIKASHFSLSAAGSSGRHNQTHAHAHADAHVDHVLFCWCHVKLLLIVKLTSVNSKVVPYTLQLNTQVPYLSDYKLLRNISHGTMKKV